ncbi:MAG TPA: hypothetical protein VD907_05130 [Verrucomicrobiae bacterium]|nr:hypothetical protein [Verrucomicrobiae bacterium]
MEPKLPAPSSLPEIPSREQRFNAPERFISNGVEQGTERDSRLESHENIQDQSQRGDPSAVLQASTSATQAATSSSPLPFDDTQASSAPLVAADDELIEKTWIEKAKSIVTQTKNDPHLQAVEVSKLQASYLLKRYGKQINHSGRD